MEKQFNISRQNRKSLGFILKRIPQEKLFEIPDGFRNNIWWNMAHIVATQQLLIYDFSGQPTRVEKSWIERYRKGTFPSGNAEQAEIDQLYELLVSTVDRAEEDYNQGKFVVYNEYTTSNKVTLSSVEDAINFNSFHEGLHLGVILSQMKALGVSLFSSNTDS